MSEKTKKTGIIYSATPREVVVFIFQQVKKHWLFFTWMFFFVILSQILNLLGPVIMKKFIDGITQFEPTASNVSSLVGIILMIGLLRLASGLTMRSTGYASSRMVPQIISELEEIGLRGVLKKSYGFFADEHMGSIVRRISKLGDTYSDLHNAFFWSILPGVATALTVIIGLLFMKPIASIAIALWIIVFIVINIIITRWKLPTDEERSRVQSVASGVLADIVTNAVTVKSFSAERQELDTFKAALQERTLAEKVSWEKSEHGLSLTDVLSASLNAGVLFMALMFWSKGQMTVGDFVLLQGLIMVLMEQLFFIGFSFRSFIESLTKASEIIGILKSDILVKDANHAKDLKVPHGEIDFSHVSFSYNNRMVISDFNLHIASGEKVAFIGPSGAGKSTIVKLILRYYDINKGKLLIDGQEIAKVTQASLREQIALVPQDPALFHRSLKENIAYGKQGASLDEIMMAAKKAHCHEFISKLPDGYETLVGERGVKLSGGERQRVAIARAILKDAPVLILDEATSALDSESEHLIQDALHTLMRNKTVIVIAHRLSTIMDMDRIIVMEDGRITDQGTHEELIQKVGKYNDLWNIQAGGFKE
ncbi:ABC transporter ATP-binding protein [Candidatus Uhrbacteria bacterium]|nr:ABC transporter ATP-binding protein [Candidatus Uhrbacteria bacterium]